MADGRMRVSLDQVDIAEIDGAYALSTEPAALAEIAAPAPHPGEPTANDEYANYQGPAVPYGWGEIEDVDVELVIDLARPPSSDEAAALERAIRAWDHAGVVVGFGTQLFGESPGYLHGLYSGDQFGPRWTNTTLRWLEDFGSADAQIAADDLARRLAGWSRHWGVAITRLQFGR